jgi:Cadherin-like beta sandwich domain
MWGHPFKQNFVWTVLFSLLATLTLSACGDSNNVSGPPAPIPLSPDAKLLSLMVNPGPLQPAFSSDGTSYTVDVSTSVASVTVAAQPQTAGATVNINGQATTNRSVTLGAAGSTTVVTIVVTAVSGSQNTYTVIVNRAPLGGDNNLSALSVTGQTLAPPFNANILNYTVNVATTVTQVHVSATKSDPGAVMSGSLTAGAGIATGQATILLGGPGSSTPITLLVTAPNNSQKTYTVILNRAAPASDNNLSALSVTGQTLAPAFNATILNYTVDVATTVTQVDVSATKSDPGAVMSGSLTAGAGIATGQATIPLGGPGSSTPITLLVAAQIGPPKTYSMTVNRAAIVLSGNNNLSDLVVSAGPLDPPFDAGTTSYNVQAPIFTADTTVTATVADSTATLTINGSPATSGVASSSIPLALGANPISIVVTAENGSQKTYTVTITRVL